MRGEISKGFCARPALKGEVRWSRRRRMFCFGMNNDNNALHFLSDLRLDASDSTEVRFVSDWSRRHRSRGNIRPPPPPPHSSRYLSVCPSVSLSSVCLSICLFVSCLSASVCPCFSVSLSVSVCVCLCLCLSVCLSVSLCLSLSLSVPPPPLSLH